jgi:hypothetical protein
MVEQAEARARPDVSLSQPVQDPAVAEGIIERIRTTVGLWLRAADPLTTNGLRRLTLSPVEIRTEMAVASAIRILGQREAAFGLQEDHQDRARSGACQCHHRARREAACANCSNLGS